MITEELKYSYLMIEDGKKGIGSKIKWMWVQKWKEIFLEKKI